MADRPRCVVDASVFVDLATRRRGWAVTAEALEGRAMHVPAHVDVEVMSALGRLERADVLSAHQADEALDAFRRAPVERHDLPGLIPGAWRRRGNLRLADALYVELADQLATTVLTSDARLARGCEIATLVP